jgi:hypothetical protein
MNIEGILGLSIRLYGYPTSRRGTNDYRHHIGMPVLRGIVKKEFHLIDRREVPICGIGCIIWLHKCEIGLSCKYQMSS